jgi:hypothetical protein
MTLRGGLMPKNAPGLDWRIYGETGEIRITATGPFLQVGYEDLTIEVCLYFPLFYTVFSSKVLEL